MHSSQSKFPGNIFSQKYYFSQRYYFNKLQGFVRSKLESGLESQFVYCPLIWMFCQRSSNTRINHLHERALRIVYNDNESTFEDLLKKDNSVSIHHKNIRLLGIELYKVKNNLSNHLMSEIFNLRNIDYYLRSQTDLKQGPVNMVNYGLKSLRYLAPNIWDIIPFEIRNLGSLAEFKEHKIVDT